MRLEGLGGGSLWRDVGYYMQLLYGWGLKGRDEFPKEFSVSQCHSAGSVDSESILVELAHLYYCSCSVPFEWVRASLVLYPDMVSYLQRWKLFGVKVEALGLYHVSVLECLLSAG